MTDPAPLLQHRIDSAAFRQGAHAIYVRLRSETPVVRARLGKQDVWLLARHADVAALMRDPRFAKNPASLTPPPRLPWIPPPFRPLMRNMLGLDDPDHARLRRLVQQAFTPRAVAAMQPRVEALCEELLDRALQHRQFDLVADYALPLPVIVIADMLGVPEADRGRFARWSRILLTQSGSRLGMLAAMPSIWRFIGFIRRLIRARQLTPRDDLISALVQARDIGDALSEDELLAMVILLLTAGHETTANLIGNSVLALLREPEQMRRLRDNPALMLTAVEELLRHSGPVDTTTHRFARETLELAGTSIPQGALVLGLIASANRDQGVFEAPDRLMLERQPNRHLSFGLGGHFCIGAALARLEAQVAIAALLRRGLPQLLRPDDPPAWRSGLVLRGLERLPLAL
jgi:cytochrome P450 PksS